MVDPDVQAQDNSPVDPGTTADAPQPDETQPSPPQDEAQPSPPQDYDARSLVAASSSYSEEIGVPVRPWMVEGALRLYAHERDISPADVRLSRDDVIAAIRAWRERPDPTYQQEAR